MEELADLGEEEGDAYAGFDGVDAALMCEETRAARRAITSGESKLKSDVGGVARVSEGTGGALKVLFCYD